MTLRPQVLLASQAEPALGPDGHRDRLRQRFIKNGLAGLADYEVVELILTLAIPRRDVKPAAKLLISHFKNLRGIMDAPLDELAQIKGVGPVAAAGLKIIRASAEAYLGEAVQDSVLLNNYARLEDFWKMRLGALTYEVVEVAYLDAAYKLLPNGVERLEEGGVDETTLHLQKLFKRALASGARFLVLAHNHPSGDLNPSDADQTLTDRVASAAQALELGLLDHWIISREGSYSFRRAGKVG